MTKIELAQTEDSILSFEISDEALESAGWNPETYPGAIAVYGSRYLGKGRHAKQSLAAYLGGRSLSLVMLACTGHYITDTVTALKLFPRTLLPSLALETTGFETDHEITAKVLARGLRIVEVPVSYFPRSKEEGKKIGLADWFIGARTFWRYRRG